MRTNIQQTYIVQIKVLVNFGAHGAPYNPVFLFECIRIAYMDVNFL